MLDVKISRLNVLNDDVLITLSKLISQLIGQEIMLSKRSIEDIIHSDNGIIFLAKQKDKIIGSFSMVIYRVPTGVKASIEDVVVDISARGKGLGESMLRFAIDYARHIGITQIDLTSKPSRVAANNLYHKVGFRKRETNVYRIELAEISKPITAM